MNAVWDVTVKISQTELTRDSLLTWGKHKGTPISKIPHDYLRWAIHNADKLSLDERRIFEQELGMFPGSTLPPPTSPKGLKDPSASEEDQSILEKTKRSWKKDQNKIRELETKIDGLEMQLKVVGSDRPTDTDVFRRIVKQFYAAMSRKYHPDMGGSAREQSIVNICYKDLIERLDRHGERP